MTITAVKMTERSRVARTLRDRYFWVLVALVATFILFTFPHDFANISWFPPYGAFSLTYTTIDHILFLIIVVFSAYRYGVIVGIATCLVIWLIHAVHDIELSVLHDTWLALVFILALGMASAWLVGSYVRVRKEKDQTQNSIAESESRYRALVNLGTDAGEAIIMLQDIDGREAVQTFVSDQWPRITGYTKDELLGISFFDFLSSKDKQASKERHRRKMSGEPVPGLFELAIIRKNGIEIPIELTGAYTTYQGTRANVLYIRDLTQRKEAETRYRTIFENTGTAMAIIEEDMTLSLVNSEYEKLSGYSRAEIEGRKTWSEFVRTDIVDRTAQCDGSGRSDPHADPGSCDLLFHNRNQETRDVLLTAAAIPRTRRLVVSIQDITERRALERALLESENLYRTLFETTGTATSIVEEDGTISMINHEWERLLGYSRQEVQGHKQFLDLFPRQLRQRMGKYFKTRITDPARIPRRYETRVVDSCGNVKDILMVVSFIPPTRRRVVSFQDITDIKRIGDILKQSESRLRLLSQSVIASQEEERASIARELHDQLGQKLTTFRLDAVSLARNHAGTELGVKLDELVQQTDELLDVGHNMATRLRPNVLDDLGLVKALQWYAESLERHTGISCPVNISNGAIDALVLPKDTATATYRIVQEALVNVMRHSKATQARITISVKGKNLVLSVADNGVGMKREQLEDRSSLGLLGMRERTSLVGGTIKISSRPGRGTRVALNMPLPIDVG